VKRLKPGESKKHKDSWNSWLLTFEVGECRYVETTYEGYPAAMRTINTPKSRRGSVLEGWKFSVSLFTAVSASAASDVRYLICITREA